MNIITITLNPAFDIHCHCDNFRPFHENLASVSSKDAGGKGINISRALKENGIDNTALVVLGKENADEFRALISSYGINAQELLVDGRIRENITLHSQEKETRISFQGFTADEYLLKQIEEIISERLDGNTLITFTGSVPKGISVNAIKNTLCSMRERGAKIVIDSKSFTMQDLVDCRAWLIKPNEEEISEYIGYEISTLRQAAKEAEKIKAQGIENVMISLGDVGAALACVDGRFVAEAPKINAVSTVGAGDSSIAGFIAAINASLSYQDALKLALCYGSAACMTEGTAPPMANDIDDLLEKVQVKQIKERRDNL